MADDERFNLPPEFLRWRERARQIREKAKLRFIPGLKMSRDGVAEDIMPMAYLLFRDRHEKGMASLIRGDLEDYMSPKNPSESRACFQYTVECILEPEDRRTAMNLVTEATSAMDCLEYLALTHPTDDWEPADMDEDDVLEKIKSYGEGNARRGLYIVTRHWNNIKESDFFQPHRKAAQETDRADIAEAKLAGISVEELRHRRHEEEIKQAKERRRPHLIRRGRQLARALQPLHLDGKAKTIRIGYQVLDDAWVECSEDLNDHLAEHLMTFRQKKQKRI